MKITRLGHACFMLESGGYRIVIDPCKGVPGVRDTEGEAEAVFCSHDHFDHCYTEKLRITDGMTSPFTVCEIPSFHDEVGGAKRGKNIIRTFRAEGISVAHLGDLGHLPDSETVAAIGACDVLLLPVGGTYTLDCAQAKEAAERIAPRVICPMHYRDGETGFDVLQTAAEFAAQYSKNDIHILPENTLTVDEAVLARGGVVFFHTLKDA